MNIVPQRMQVRLNSRPNNMATIIIEENSAQAKQLLEHIKNLPLVFAISFMALTGALYSCTDSRIETEITEPETEITEPETEATKPEPEFYNTNFAVAVNDRYIPVHTCKVAPKDPERRWKAMDDVVNSYLYFDTAAFAYFDLTGSGADIRISYPQKIHSVKILPSAAAISSSVQDNSVSFHLDRPANLTIEINGDYINSLHLFANPPETDIPDRNDPNVIFFGPGVHEVSNIPVGNDKTLYIAEGAIIKGVIDPSENWYYHNDGSGLKGYVPLIDVRGKNIKIRGRGIIDCSEIPSHGKNPLFITGDNISIEGIIITNSPTWTMPIVESRHVSVNNAKIIGHRSHSDGIDICNSHNVVVDGCFIRTLDDLVVVKTHPDAKGTAGDIEVRNCVLWNQVAHALSIGAEITNNITNVLFENCDVIHDIGREHTLRIYHTDAATVKNIKFENIRVEESTRLISLWIGEAIWSTDKQRGNIENITFSNITAQGNPLKIEFKGHSPQAKINNILLNNITLNSKPLSPNDIIKNEHATNITINP